MTGSRRDLPQSGPNHDPPFPTMIDTAGGRRRLLHTLAALAAGSTATLAHRASAQPRRRLRFGVGPFLPTPDDSRRAFAPLFAHLARQLGASDHTLDLTTDWAGLAVAMASVLLRWLSAQRSRRS